MNASELRTYLKEEYGICSDEDFELAVQKSTGLDIGLFTQPLIGGNYDKKTEGIATA